MEDGLLPWFTKEPRPALPVMVIPKPGYYQVIMAKLNVESKAEIKQLAAQNNMNFTEFCLSVYDSVPEMQPQKITIVFHDDNKPLKESSLKAITGSDSRT